MTNRRLTDAVTATDNNSRLWKTRIATARMAYEQGELHEAANQLTRAMELAKQMKERTYAINTTMIGLGAVRIALGQLKEAERHLKDAMSALQSFVDDDMSKLYAIALRFHADLLSEKGDEKSAERELQNSASILENLGADGVVQLAYTLCDLGSLYLRQSGQHAEAEQYILAAMDLILATLGPEDPEFARADIIYHLCHSTNDQAEMLDLAEAGMTKLQYLLGAKHPHMMRAARRYATALKDRGDSVRFEEAKRRFAGFEKTATTKELAALRQIS
jgi:tetratricopeptide (TPR) repeat protein